MTEISDPSGAVVEWVTYDVYGAATIRDQAGSTASSSAVGSPFLFTGREYDADSGLYHYRARAYDPAGGRFLQRDPLGYVDGLNDREYVSSRPAGLRDPGGTKSDGPPAPIRVKYPKSSNPDPAAAAAEDKAAAKKAVDDWNKANPDNPVPKDVADSIKDALILPQAFVSAMRGDSEQEFRERCVETLVQAEALDYMIDTLKAIATETGKHAA